MTEYIYFQTYGCTANQNNTEIMKGLVRSAGLEITNNPDISDIILINTCIVKEPTEKKIERRISDLRKKYSEKPIIIAGCMPEVRNEKLKQENIYLLGIHHLHSLPLLIKKIYNSKYQEQEFLTYEPEVKLLKPKISKKDIGITQISEGCQGNCSFCIVRIAKGKLFSYPEEKIIENIKNDLKHVKEIWITSQDNASYGLDRGKRELPELMKKILELKSKFKIRLGMMNPENVLPILSKLIEIYKNEKLKPFLHIPVQSGSNNILKSMNRRYSIKDFLFIVNKFKKEIPDLFLSTDIIVGFPEETEEDFQETLNIIKKIKPQQVNVSRFWSLKGTEAEKMKQLDVKIVKQRTKTLMNLIKEYKN